MKQVIIVDEANIDLIHPYSDNDQVLSIGDELHLVEPAHMPCVWIQPGLCRTFSIYRGKRRQRYSQIKTEELNHCAWMWNRFSINDKFTK